MTVRKLAGQKCPTKSPCKKEADPPSPRLRRTGGPENEWAGRGLSPNQRAFLEAFACGGSIRLAAEAAKVSRRNHCRWLKSDPKYAEAFEDARERAIEAMEAEARRRAVEGVREPVFFEGEVCGHRQRYSDNLLMFLLKGANLEKYRDRADVTHRTPEPIPVNVNLGAELMRKVLEAGAKPGVPGLAQNGS